MPSMPMYHQQRQEQQPQDTVTQQYYNDAASQHGSVGPVIGVLIAIIVLGIIAVMIGRLCSGRRIMGHGEFDIESWAERKCSTCIDGRVNLSVPRANEPSTSLPATPIHTSEENKQAEPEPEPEPSSSQNSPPPNS